MAPLHARPAAHSGAGAPAAAPPAAPGPGPPLAVLVTGASGLVGAALTARLAADGHRVRRLVRAAAGAADLAWDPAAGRLAPAALAGFDAVVHLAGENLAAGRWSAGRRRRIRDSRTRGTRLLAEAIAGLARPPAVLVCASAVGYYGDRGGSWLSEDSPPGSGFLAEVCRDWEAASEPAEARGVRVVRLRLGAVLAGSGGLLARLAPLFRLGLGGRVGSGRQYLSWISLPDVLEVARRALRDPGLRGAVNAVSPAPVPQAEFAAALGRALRRPARLPLPAWAVRLALGEMGRELLLSGARVRPARLLEAGFAFRHPELPGALAQALGR